MSDKVENAEITLSAGDLRLKVAPFGASLRGMWREAPDGTRQEIVTGYTGAKGKVGGQGDVLIPFPGRVRDGRYTFEGQTYQMPQNDKDGPNAIHGFLRLTEWEVDAQKDDMVMFSVSINAGEHSGYPFSMIAMLIYSLSEYGLHCAFSMKNLGEQNAPVAAGFHPYFTVGSEQIDADTLHVPMASTLEMVNLLPTGAILPVGNTAFDFRSPRPIGATAFNTCYLDPIRDSDGNLRLKLGSADGQRGVTVWMDEAFNYVVLYSGDPLPPSHRRRSLAIEPMTCAADGFNHPEWGLVSLPPGETFTGAWGVEV